MFGQKPKMSTKSLEYLEDVLEHEALLYRKYMQCAGEFQDQNLITMAQQAANHHKQRFDGLYNYLQSHQ